MIKYAVNVNKGIHCQCVKPVNWNNKQRNNIHQLHTNKFNRMECSDCKSGWLLEHMVNFMESLVHPTRVVKSVMPVYNVIHRNVHHRRLKCQPQETKFPNFKIYLGKWSSSIQYVPSQYCGEKGTQENIQ